MADKMAVMALGGPPVRPQARLALIVPTIRFVLPLLAALVLAPPQDLDLEPAPPTPYDRVIELEITADDEPLLDGRGPTVVYEYQVAFEGNLHIWTTSSELDLFLQVDNTDEGYVRGSDGDAGGGTTPYIRLGVQEGDRLAVLVAGGPGAVGTLGLHLIAAPENLTTRKLSELAKAETREIEDLGRSGAHLEARERLAKLISHLTEADPADGSDLIAERLWMAGLAALPLSSPDLSSLAWQPVREQCERTLPPEHANRLSAIENLALALRELGDLDGTLDSLEHVHAIRERLLPPDDPTVLQAKLNLASSRRLAGDLEGALTLIHAVYVVREQTLPHDHPALVMAKSNLAVMWWALGDFAGALELHEQVHAVRLESLPPDHPDLIDTQRNLATVRLAAGDVSGALELLERVVAAQDRLLAADHPEALTTRSNLAVALQRHGDYERALELAEATHATQLRLLPSGHPSLLTSQENLADIHLLLGNRERALELFEAVHAGRDQLFPSGHSALLVAKGNLAVASHAVGDCKAAIRVTRSLLESQRVVAAQACTTSPRTTRATIARELHSLATVFYILGATEPTSHCKTDALWPDVFAALESLRAVATNSSRVALMASRLEDVVALREKLLRVRAMLANTTLSAPTHEAAVDDWRRQILDLAEERDRLEYLVLSKFAEHGVAIEQPTVDAVAGGLRPSAAYVSYLRYDRVLQPDSAADGPGTSVESLLAFIVLPDARIELVEFGPVAPIEEALYEWRASIGQPVHGRGVGVTTVASAPDTVAAGEALRSLVVDPVLRHLPDVNDLHVVLDDFMHLIPLDALPMAGGAFGDLYRVHQRTTALGPPSGTSLHDSESLFVVLGGIDYDAEVGMESDATRSPALSRAGRADSDRSLAGEFSPLVGAALEVDSLVELWRKQMEIEPVVLRAAEATKARLFEEAPGARYLHLATHGWFEPEAVSLTTDTSGVRQGFAEVLLRAEETVRSFAPQTLCGLALAGANRGTDDANMPGILTAEELSMLDLRNCELAVLSACETNVGISRAGQGIQSLQTALHAAGARTSITSLWKVEDAATRRLFELFYTKLWKEKLGKADALWHAKMALRSEGHPVRDWAGWVLTGDPD
jgi:tetratricopeptide (TPR) repeat protein